MEPVRCVQQANAILGEGPSWSHSEGILYWVDIERPAVFRFDPAQGQTGHWPMPRTIGCAAPAQSGRLVYADRDGFGYLNLADGTTNIIADTEKEITGNRFNDGKVDRKGRLWAGTLDMAYCNPTGSLYRLDPDGTVNHMASGFTCSNGLGWSPDDQTMYFTDSTAGVIWAYEFDADSGSLGPRRVFASLQPSHGLPDGLTVDREGFVWSAIWNGWRVIRFAPDGRIDLEVKMPVQRPSSCMFGDADLRTLYITSACVELGWGALKSGPLAGSLFAMRTDVPGMPETLFGG
jgi:sugar lactone lactonase YvrE